MLAGLLCNLPRPGGVPGATHERAERALLQLRAQFFDERDVKNKAVLADKIEAAETIVARPVYKIPPIQDITELELPGLTAMPGKESVDDEELALLFIIANI